MQSKLISFVISETTKAKKGKVEQVPPAKSAPHYFETTMPQQFIIKQAGITIAGKKGSLTLKSYQPEILVAEITLDLEDPFSEEVFTLREAAVDECHEILKKNGGKDVEEFSEEYSIFAISNYEGDPDQFFQHKETIASLLKSEKLSLDPQEIDYTFSSQLKYAKNDSVIMDWDGAFIFDPDGDYDSTIELFQLANLQLLRYRILDKDLDGRLHKIASLIEHSPDKTKFLFNAHEINEALKDTIRVRSGSIYEFQALEREIKLIGDWYWARLYDLIVKKFKIEEWRRSVREKLDAIEDVYTIASENFTVSWERRAHIIEMVGWYVLLIGWFVLLAFDIYFQKIR